MVGYFWGWRGVGARRMFDMIEGGVFVFTVDGMSVPASIALLFFVSFFVCFF